MAEKCSQAVIWSNVDPLIQSQHAVNAEPRLSSTATPTGDGATTVGRWEEEEEEEEEATCLLASPSPPPPRV
eukprot:COSAG06_NODE_16782_length_981_cov_1.158730_1_plen_71_part_01